MRTLRVALAQINATVGDIEGNARKISDGIERAKEVRADIVAFPELSVTGYPPEDLLFKPHFVARNKEAVGELVERVPKSLVAVVGFVYEHGGIFNAAAVLHDGKVVLSASGRRRIDAVSSFKLAFNLEGEKHGETGNHGKGFGHRPNTS